VNKENVVKKGRELNRTGAGVDNIPICGTSTISYFWWFKKPHEVSALLIQYMIMKAA
jgi:hypothetical protein